MVWKVVYTQMVPACLLTLSLGALLYAGGQEAPNPSSLDELISRIADAEKRLVNLRIECEASEEERVLSTDPWKPSGVSTSCTAWFNGLPGSKARVDVQQETLRHAEQGFFQQSYSASYDGQVGRIVRHGTGAPGAMSEEKRAEIEPSAPKRITNSWHEVTTGRAFCLNFLANDQAVPFSELLKSMKAAGTRLDVAREKYQGADCLRISISVSGETYWLDAEHALAFRGYEYTVVRNGHRRVWRRKVVTELGEAAPGVWYPQSAIEEYHSMDPNRPRENRILFHASKTIANDPFFDEEVFRAPIPPGYTVIDKILGTVYRMGLENRALERQLTELADSIQSPTSETAEDEYSDNSQSSKTIRTATQEAEDATLAERTPLDACIRDSGSVWIYAIVAFGVLAASGGVYMVRKRRTRMRGSPLLILAAACAISPGISVARTTITDTAADYHFNCGLNIACVTLRCLGYSPSLEQVAEETDVGRDFARQASMLDLKHAFEEHGLKVDAFKADSVPEIVQSVKTGAFCIVHTSAKLGLGSAGHYIALTTQGDRFCLIDPPKPTRWLTKSQIVPFLEGSHATGNLLVVTRSPAVRRKGPAIYIENTRTDLGRIRVTSENVEGTIKYRNVGTDTLRILHVGGPCSCYGGYSGTCELPPDQEGELKVVFLKDRLPCGHLKRSLKIVSNDPTNPVLTVYFTFFVQPVPAANDIRLLPQKIDFGRATAAQIAEQQVLVRLFIPYTGGYLAEKVKAVVTQQYLRLDLLAPDEVQESNSLGRSCQVLTYRVSWNDPPSVAPFQGEIRFMIPRQTGDEMLLTVPFRGDAI